MRIRGVPPPPAPFAENRKNTEKKFTDGFHKKRFLTPSLIVPLNICLIVYVIHNNMFIYHDTRNLKNHSFNFQVEVRDLMHNDYDLSSAFDKVKDVKKKFRRFQGF